MVKVYSLTGDGESILTFLFTDSYLTERGYSSCRFVASKAVWIISSEDRKKINFFFQDEWISPIQFYCTGVFYLLEISHFIIHFM